jgi:cytochrome c-type biogenesis protein
MTVTLFGAFLAGLLSFISPCVLPLVPPYLSFLAGVTFDEFTGEENTPGARRRVFLTAVAFVLGFSAVFVALGATASALGQATRGLFAYTITVFGLELSVVSVVAGLIIIVMGLHFLGVFRIGLLSREARFQVERHPAGVIGAFLFGMAFAFGWTPCIGPVLSTIVAIAGSRETVYQGMTLLGAYSLGMGIPFLVAALFAGPFMRLMRRFRRHMGTVERAMGAFLVLIGVLFIFGQMTAFNVWLVNTFPALV